MEDILVNRSLAFAGFLLVCAATASAGDSPSAALQNDQSPEAVLREVKTIESEHAAQDAAVNAPIATDVPLKLDAVAVIKLTARFSPRIRRAYERKVAREARYDFFIYNREAFSYGASAPFEYNRQRNRDASSLEKTLSPQVFVRQEFYDTSSASMRVGYDLYDYQSGHEGNAFVSGTISVPLFASREALQRSNEKIYEQNEVNDARLEYYQQIREQISDALYDLTWAQRNQENLESLLAYRADLDEIIKTVNSVSGRDTSADLAKVQAIRASISAEYESGANSFEIATQHLRNTIGIPFSTHVTVGSNNFNPFEGETQEELERVALESDEEIKTLLNSIKNAQLELELARKGKWDTTLTLGASRSFAGDGDEESDADYDFLAGVEVTHIDDRISRSLEQIALANIREYRNAIVDRRREIHTDIIEAYTNLVGQMAEVKAREANISKYSDDFKKGLELYKSGAIVIDDLIQKRKDLRNEENSISDARHGAHEALVSLVSSTGRYEQFIDSDNQAKQSGGKQR